MVRRRAVELAPWGGQVARQLFYFQIQTETSYTGGSGRRVLGACPVALLFNLMFCILLIVQFCISSSFIE